MNIFQRLFAVMVAIIAMAAFCVAIEVRADVSTPRFVDAIPVWPEGCTLERNAFFGFRVSFDASEGERPILRIAGCSAYRIFLNGRHIGYGPARAPKGFFRVDEISLQVCEGKNTLAIEVAGYNCQSYYHVNQPSFLQAEIVSGESIIAATGRNGDFEAVRLPRVGKTVRYSFQRTYTEQYRLSRGFDDWKRDVGAFEKLSLERCADVRLLPRRAQYADFRINGQFKALSAARCVFDPHMKTKEVRFVDRAGSGGRCNAFAKEELESNWWDLIQRYSATNRIPVAADGDGFFSLAEGNSVLFDAGLNDTGFPGLRVECRRAGTVAFKFDEILLEGEVSPTRNSTANVVVWEFKEPGVYSVEAFEPYTFRYADVIACSGDFRIGMPYLRTFKNPEARRASFSSSDLALVKIFEAARETYAQNAVDVFSDCPGRERAGWLCDSFFTARSSLLFTGELKMEHLFLENYMLPDRFEYLPEGVVAMCYPADFPSGDFIPNWMMWLVLQVEEFRLRGGDSELVAAFRPRLEGIVSYLWKFRNSDGLLEKLPRWVFVEWSQANRLVQDVNYPSNMMWAEVLDAMHRLYGRPDLAEEAQNVRAEVRRQSWTGSWFCDNAVRGDDGALRLSGQCTETCQYYAFYFRTATKESHPELWKTLVDDFGSRRKKTNKYPEIWSSNAFIGNYLRLECLSREGLSSQIVEETRDFFLYMADRTGTLWEHDKISASCCHAFASHVAVTFLRDLVGVREIDWVNRKVKFVPPQDVPVRSILMEIPVGDGNFIRAGWKKENARLFEELKLPQGWSRKVDMAFGFQTSGF